MEKVQWCFLLSTSQDAFQRRAVLSGPMVNQTPGVRLDALDFCWSMSSTAKCIKNQFAQSANH